MQSAQSNRNVNCQNAPTHHILFTSPHWWDDTGKHALEGCLVLHHAGTQYALEGCLVLHHAGGGTQYWRGHAVRHHAGGGTQYAQMEMEMRLEGSLAVTSPLPQARSRTRVKDIRSLFSFSGADHLSSAVCNACVSTVTAQPPQPPQPPPSGVAVYVSIGSLATLPAFVPQCRLSTQRTELAIRKIAAAGF